MSENAKKVEPTIAELTAYVRHLREVIELVNRETACSVRSFTLEEFIENGWDTNE